MRYQGRRTDFWDRVGDALIANLSADRILTIIINLAIILAIIHFIIIPLSRHISADLQAGDTEAGSQQVQHAAQQHNTEALGH